MDYYQSDLVLCGLWIISMHNYRFQFVKVEFFFSKLNQIVNNLQVIS